MAFLTSIVHENFKRNFLVFFILSSALPLLFMIYITFKDVIPILTADQITDLKTTFTYGVLVMLLPPLLGFILGSKWVSSIESLSKEIKSKAVQIVGERHEFEDENEFAIIHQGFNELHDELQDKMKMLNEVSKKLMDSNVKLKELATTDELTALFNRRYFDLRLTEEVSRSERDEQDLSLIMIDFDGFKKHNDTYGHQTGDKLLSEMANLIRTSLRKSDMVFRYGGDEFAVLVPGCDIKKAEHLAKGIAKKVSSHQFETLEGKPIERLTISCGVASYQESLETFVAEADRCLFAAKNAGKGLVVAQAKESSSGLSA
jgi:diguanylate cyclase (GGDEF)-like protein